MDLSDEELSWPSSSELDELAIYVGSKDESEVWYVTKQQLSPELTQNRQNSWTPVNPPSKRIMVASALPPLISVDDEDEQPSLLASRHREAILCSAERIKLSTKSRKRKASLSSPSGARKKRAVGVTNVIPSKQIAKPENVTVVRKQKSERSGHTVPATPQKKKDNCLLPTPPSSLNIQSTPGTMLTTMSELTSHSENTPLKYWANPVKAQAETHRKNGKTDVNYLSAMMPKRREPS